MDKLLLEMLRAPDNWEARFFKDEVGTPSDAPFKAADEIERLSKRVVELEEQLANAALIVRQYT